MTPTATDRATFDKTHDVWLRTGVPILISHSVLISLDHLFEDPRCDDTRKIRSPRSSSERQTEPNQIVRWIADDRLVEIADLDCDGSLTIAQRTQIA